MSKSYAVDDVSEEWIKAFVFSRVSDSKDNLCHVYLSRDGIRYEIMSERKKDMTDTNNVIEKMKSLGLDLCTVHYPDPNDPSNFRVSDIDHLGEYDLLKFIRLRGWL